MLTRIVFTGIVIAVVIQRLLELRISKRHIALLLAEGGKEHSSNSLWMVKTLQISWFIAMVVETWVLSRPFVPTLAAAAILATVTGQGLRYLSMQALGQRWTLPIVTVPGRPVVTEGVYRYIRHPNWLGVFLEITMLPLIHSAYLTAILFTLANSLLMARRIQAEEQALFTETNYAKVFDQRPRFLPFIFGC